MRLLIQFFSLLCFFAFAIAQQAAGAGQDETYDFIVIGSGPGGGPLASRLARAGHKVLLIDAGDDEGHRLSSQIPGLQGQSTEDPNYRWDFFVEMYDDLAKSKKNARMTYSLPDGTIYSGLNPPAGAQPLGLLYPRASALGGCALHNAMVTNRWWIRDFEYLAELTGNLTWFDPDLMLKYFERFERAEYVPISPVGHGFSGWLPVSLTALDIVAEDVKLLGMVLAALRAQGSSIDPILDLLGDDGLLGELSSVPDLALSLAKLLLSDMNAPGRERDVTEAVWQVPIAVDPVDSTRSSPLKFIKETAESYPLTLRLNTLVTKILFDESGPRPRAIGVEYLQGKSLYAADPRYKKSDQGTPGREYAKHEVILAGGAFNSPQLLKLSGVGPKAELEQWGIPVVHDLPGVGENLQDRYEAVVVGESTSNFTIIEQCTFLRTGDSDPCYQTWKNGITPYLRGVYGSNGLALGITYRSSVADGPEPDVFMSGVPVSFTGYEPEWATKGTSHSNYWSWYMLKARSKNRAGSVTLRSTDPRDTPRISFRTMGRDTLALQGDKDDLQAMYEGFLHMRKMFADFVSLDGSSFTEVVPGSDMQDEAAIKEHLMDQTWGHHAGGTCAIGADDDPMAVLHHDNRVRGIDGLRVVDASSYSKIPGFFIATWVYTMSERASDLILLDYPVTT